MEELAVLIHQIVFKKGTEDKFSLELNQECRHDQESFWKGFTRSLFDYWTSVTL
jgi:hypothetical protein